MKNKIGDVRDHLVGMMEDLGEAGVDGNEMAQRIQRAKGMSQLAGAYIETVKVELQAAKLANEIGYASPAAGGRALIEQDKGRA